MRVRDFIEVSRPAGGGLDVPLVFELEQEERAVIARYLDEAFQAGDLGDLYGLACRLAERGIPQAIEQLVIEELLAQGRRRDAMAVGLGKAPFPCPQSKVAS